MAGLFNTIAKRLRQVAFSFREKPPTKVDDYVLEHFLLYHGLVGTSPDNQRSFRDVRQDIFLAIDNGSSLQLGIALKLQPLWWEDKLKTIFDEAPNKSAAAAGLLPQLEDNSWPNQSDPLGHPEWQVRANAATMLAHLKHTEAEERLSRALDDTADNSSAAFCHVAYALGRLNTTRAIEALRTRINTDEPWFRVDVAGALAASSSEDIYSDLAEALFSNHALQDYTAVAIAKSRKPEQFFSSSQAIVQDAGCLLVIGLLQASKQTFNSDLIEDLNLADLLPTIVGLADRAPNPIRIHAAITLASWIAEQGPTSEKVAESKTLIQKYNTADTAELLRKYLNLSAAEPVAEAECNQRHAIQLLGELKMHSALPDLLRIIETKSGLVNLAIEAIEKLGDASASTALVALANRLCNLDQRTTRPLSKNPVAEDQEADAKTYWQILKALGSLPAPNSMTLLVRCTNDFAPDKREQAVTSLISAYEKNRGLMSKTTIVDLIKKALADQSASLRVVALDGAARLDLIEPLEQIIDLFDARETSVAKQAKKTISTLWELAHKSKIEPELQARIKKETDGFKRKKLVEFLEELHEINS